MDLMQELAKNLAEGIGSNLGIEEVNGLNINEIEKIKKEEEKKKAAEKRKKARDKKKKEELLKKIKEEEITILLEQIPEFVEIDDDFPLFFPVFSMKVLENEKRKFKIICSNSLFEFQNKIKEFLSFNKKEKWFYSPEYTENYTEWYDLFVNRYNSNELTLLHLHENFQEFFKVKNKDFQIMIRDVPFLTKEILEKYHWDYNGRNGYINDFKSILNEYNITNNIKLQKSPKFVKMFWTKG